MILLMWICIGIVYTYMKYNNLNFRKVIYTFYKKYF